MEKTHPLWGAKWVAGSKDAESPFIIRKFRVESTGKAVLHITGLGYFHAQINGKDVTRLLRYLANYDPATGDSSVQLGK